MRGGILPPALLFAALGLALSLASARAALIGALAAAAAALAIYWIGVPAAWIEIIFVGCWLSVMGTAALTYLPILPNRAAIAAAVNVGVWAGAVSAVSGSLAKLMLAVPCVAIAVIGRLLAKRGWTVALRVAASWLIAVSVLVAMLPLIPTPGYAPDHMD